MSPNILNDLYPSVDIVYDYGDDIAAKFPCQWIGDKKVFEKYSVGKVSRMSI